MLHWHDKTVSHLWSNGSAELFLDERRETGVMPVAVRCQFGSQPAELAMLDTGAHWSLIGADLVELLGDELGEELEPITISSRLGTYRGTLHRLPIRLVAEWGTDLIIEGTCAALKTWNGPSILGFKGFLERLRIALEPGDANTAARIHFGYNG